MQSLLYLIEDADAHGKLGKVNVALKKYVAIQKVKTMRQLFFHS